jgi:hypothetical protein
MISIALANTPIANHDCILQSQQNPDKGNPLRAENIHSSVGLQILETTGDSRKMKRQTQKNEVSLN